jgi:hypothetical protein
MEARARLAWADKQGTAGVLFTSMDGATRLEIDRWLSQQMAQDGWKVPFPASEPLAMQYLPTSSYTN